MKQPTLKEKAGGTNLKKKNPLSDGSLQSKYLIHSKPN